MDELCSSELGQGEVLLLVKVPLLELLAVRVMLEDELESSEPTPQGTAEPSGCTACSGAVFGRSGVSASVYLDYDLIA